jgi:hypothetical protein
MKEAPMGTTPEQQREYARKWRAAHPNYQREYAAKNPDKRRKWNREWIAANRPAYNASKWAYRERTKLAALAHYGNGVVACVRCGFDNPDALCLDHIEDNGAEHRRELGISGRGSGSGMTAYEKLKVLGWPEGMQTLCHNCNWIKEAERRRRERGYSKQDITPEA